VEAIPELELEPLDVGSWVDENVVVATWEGELMTILENGRVVVVSVAETLGLDELVTDDGSCVVIPVLVVG
jgi:hypothetical protein